jgi:hypothetical protein
MLGALSFGATALLLFTVLSTSGCKGFQSKIIIDDEGWYGSLGPDGAAEFHTLTDEQYTYTMPQFLQIWNNPKDPLVATHLSTFTQIKKEMEVLCAAVKRCDPHLMKTFNGLYDKMVGTLHPEERGD